MARNNELRAVFTANASGFNRAVKNMGKGMIGATGAVAAMGATVLAAIGVKGVQAASAFGLQMAEVATLTKLSASETAKMSEGVRGLAVEFGATTEELTGGLYQALSAGVPKDNAIDFLRVAAMAAQAGVTDVKTAVDGISSVLNAFEMDASQAEEVADSLFTTVRGGKTTFAELAQNIGKVAPIANAAGVSMDEMNALLVQMTKRGLSTEEATTALKGTLTALIKPAGDLASQLGNVKKNGLVATLEDMVKASGGSVESLAKLFPNVRGLLGVLSSGLNGGGINKTLDEFANKAGNASRASGLIAGTMSKQFDVMQSKAGEALLRVGEGLVPEVQKVMDEMTELFADEKFEGALKSFGTNLSVILGLAIPAIEKLTATFASLAETGKDLEEWVNPTADPDNQKGTIDGQTVSLAAPARGPGGKGLKSEPTSFMLARLEREQEQRMLGLTVGRPSQGGGMEWDIETGKFRTPTSDRTGPSPQIIELANAIKLPPGNTTSPSALGTDIEELAAITTELKNVRTAIEDRIPYLQEAK